MNLEVSEKTQQIFVAVDDREAILEGILPALSKKYPTAQILTARDRTTAQKIVQQHRPNLVMLDLSIPDKLNSPAHSEVGIEFLSNLIGSSLAANIAILSSNIQSLVRLKSSINSYRGGFVAIDESLPIAQMLKFIDLVLQGLIHLSMQIRSLPEFDRKLQELLKLKFQQGLTDKAIAKRMSLSDRTIRNYWLKVQDVLNIYPEPDKDLQIQIEIKARKIGLLD